MLESISTLLVRDLTKLKSEIEAYSDESKLWILEGQIANTAGNLCLHLTGNLQHFIGAVLGDSGYVRDRHAEFNDTHVSRREMLARVDTTIDVVSRTLASLDQSELNKPYPQEVFGYEMQIQFFLIHLHGHLNYHLGQINYHRRLVDRAK